MTSLDNNAHFREESDHISAVTKTGKSCLQEQVSQVQEQVDRDRQSDSNYWVIVCTLFTCYTILRLKSPQSFPGLSAVSKTWYWEGLGLLSMQYSNMKNMSC